MKVFKYVKPAVASLVIGLSASSLAWAHTASTSGQRATMMPMSMKKVLDEQSVLNQNSPRGRYMSSCNMKGKCRMLPLKLKGFISGDFAYSSRGNPVPDFVDFSPTSKYSNHLRLSNFALFVDSRINHWMTAAATVNYKDIPQRHPFSSTSNYFTHWDLDEAYLRYSCFETSPLFAQLGFNYSPFGSYSSPYVITQSLPQMLEQFNDVMLQVGFVDDSGLHGVLFALNRDDALVGRVQVADFGAKVGYTGDLNGTLFHASLSYITDIRYARVVREIGLAQREGGFSAHLDAHYQQFSGQLDYVTALGDLVALNTNSCIWAFGAHLGYAFKASDMPAVFGIGYQRSGQADFFELARLGPTNATSKYTLPKERFVVDMNVKLSPRARVTFQYLYNKPYVTPAAAVDPAAVTPVTPVAPTEKDSQSFNIRVSADLL